MTDREREILEWIRRNPLISQNDLAKELNITRSSVAVHISNLIKKGFIKGKGYVLTEGLGDIIVIGGANVDMTGHVDEGVKLYDSNPGAINTTYGGVGRNIAENLARLGLSVKLIAAIGDDYHGEKMIKHCESVGIDMSLAKKYSGDRTSIYMQILNKIGELELAVADMDITSKLTKRMIADYHHYLDSAKAIVVDCNVNADIIGYLSDEYGGKLFIDPVSRAKSQKIKAQLKTAYCVTPNKYELNEIGKGDNLEERITSVVQQGVEHVVVTLGGDGLVYYDKRLHKRDALSADLVNVTGAGDAFVAGLVYGYVNEVDFGTSVEYGLKMAKLTVESQNTVSEKLHDNILEE